MCFYFFTVHIDNIFMIENRAIIIFKSTSVH